MRLNLCQVHLADLGLYDDLARDGWPIEPGQLGENVTTRGIDLMSLPGGTSCIWAPVRASGSPESAAHAIRSTASSQD